MTTQNVRASPDTVDFPVARYDSVHFRTPKKLEESSVLLTRHPRGAKGACGACGGVS